MQQHCKLRHMARTKGGQQECEGKKVERQGRHLQQGVEAESHSHEGGSEEGDLQALGQLPPPAGPCLAL